MAHTNRTQKVIDSVDSASNSARETISDTASDVRENIAEMGASVSRTTQDALTNVSQRMRDVGVDPDALAETARKQASKLQEAVEEELRERPVRTLAIAAAVGLVVGMMTTR